MHYNGCYQVGGYSGKFNYEFVLLVVLFILLIIVGAYFCK
ncbi:YjcZ family sporulation protein [Lysinibacillus telephonicus]|uniref:YjcZ family sporulation protein n=1 Tax=Lysinibacillus telephonicus TaxID=1714840 RepID=A0A431UX60_9BACI|nr:YjcZ family sporulation protein [Lysinibacillus telephonicus]RTQ96057.1 YjcZ family sporulation protein [Lysinibacillus telephonicus]